jgi:hypothetical protein
MAISFLGFIMALVWDFLCLGNPDNKVSFVFSMGLTISGALAGSFYMVWSFANYMREMEKVETSKPT